MTRWYEAANEASFKTAAEGYVFQSPNPWIFARPRYYLVNQAQKAEISAHLGRWRLLLVISLLTFFVLMGSFIAFVTLSPATVVRLVRPALQLGFGYFVMFTITITLMTLLMCVAVPQIYLSRALRPLLADAPRTEERIKVSEQLPKIAASVSSKVLVVGIIGGLGMIGGGVLAFLDAEVRLAGAISVFVGGLGTSYFIYLVRLKAKLKRTAL